MSYVNVYDRLGCRRFFVHLEITMIDQRTAPYAALVLRLSLGVLFLVHGYIKLFVFTVPGTVGFFQSIGYPALFAYLVLLAEVGGGIALILGFMARWVALLQIPLMLGAMQFHFANGFEFSNPNGGWEYPALWTAVLVVQALLGNGA